MRILAVLESLGTGGTEWQAVSVFVHMVRRGVHVDVVTLFPPPAGTDQSELAERLAAAGVSLNCLGLSHRWSVPEGAVRLIWHARRRRIDILHARLYFPALHVASTRYGAPALKRVVSYHNVIYDYPNRSRWDGLRQQCEAALVSNFHGIAAVSETVAESYRRNLSIRNRINVIPNAIDVDEIHPQAGNRHAVAHRYGLDPALRWVLLPARFVFEKGHDVLLDAMTRLAAEQAPFQALCVGRGPLREGFLDAVRERGLGNVVQAPGEVRRAEVLELMDACDVVALPSRFEGFPNTAAEAMAKGKPLVSTTIGPLRQLVDSGRDGLLVPPNDPACLAEAVMSLSEADRRREIGARARQRIVSDYSIDRVVDRWISFYRDVHTGV